MLEQDREEADDLVVRELLQAMEMEIAEFRRLKDASASSAEPKEDSARDLAPDFNPG